MLRAFLTEVSRSIGPSNALSRLDFHAADLDRADVKREYKDFDLCVVLPSIMAVVVVELKIRSSQHGNQLSRYRDAAKAEWPTKNGWKHLFIFLRPNEEAAEDPDWIEVDFNQLVTTLEYVAAKRLESAPAAKLLLSYVAMIRRVHMQDETLEYLAFRIWKKHRLALQFLMQREPDVVQDLLNWLKEESKDFAKELSLACKLTVEADHHQGGLVRFLTCH